MTALSTLLADFEKEIRPCCRTRGGTLRAGERQADGRVRGRREHHGARGARLKLANEQTRADAAAAAGQASPQACSTARSPSRGVPRALKPIFRRSAPRNMGKLDPSGVGAMMVDVDAAEARVSAVLEAIAPAAAFACWQTQHTRVGPASGPGSSRRMKPLRPDDPTEGLAEEHEMDQRREDALEKIGKCLRESRTRLLLLTRDAHKKIEDVMAGDGEPGTATEGIPALPARVANGVLAVTARLREAATNWGALLDDAGEQEHYAVGNRRQLVRKRAPSRIRRGASSTPATPRRTSWRRARVLPSWALPPPPPPREPRHPVSAPRGEDVEEEVERGYEDPPNWLFGTRGGGGRRGGDRQGRGRGGRGADRGVRRRLRALDRLWGQPADPHDVDAVAPAAETELAR